MDIGTLAAENKALRDINARQKQDINKLVEVIGQEITRLRKMPTCEVTPTIVNLEQAIRRFK